jgi:hypothetical protein
MNALPDRCDPAVEEKLSVLSPVPAREPEAVDRGRARFLAEARALQPVMQPTKPSRNGWFGALAASLQIKKRAPALIVLASIAVVFAILLGGTTATVYAAQGSMPGQLLYSVKLLSEDIRLGLTSEPQAELTLISELVNRRLEEIDYLVLSGEDVPDYVVDRLDASLDQATIISEAIDGDKTATGRGPVLDRDRDQGRTSYDDAKEKPLCNGEENAQGDPGCIEIAPEDGSTVSGEGQPGDGTDNTSGSGAGNQGSSGSTDGTGSGSGQQPVNPEGSSGPGNGPDPQPAPDPQPDPDPAPASDKAPQPDPQPDPTPTPVLGPVQNCEGGNCPVTDPAQVPPVSDDGSSSGDSSGDPSVDPSGDGNKSP